ncbi:MAG: ABC transporter permease [Desulfovibrio sp.]|nr:ABC transporter permease [Desulfovibrio sp.]
MAQLTSAAVIQCRSIAALMLLEINTLYGDARLGYFWALVKTAFGVLALLMLRIFMHARAPHGIPAVVFLILGFMIWQIFSQTLTKTLTVIKNNKNFLTFPQVTPLDIIVARTLVIIATEVVCATILLSIFYLVGLIHQLYIYNILLMLGSIFGTACFGVSCGCIILAISRYVPVIVRIIPMCLRVLFFASGVFFSVSAFSHRFGIWLLYNPVMQFIEMSRSAFSYSYPYYFDPEYLMMVLLPLFTIGILLERYMRKFALK